ncbi:dihydroorotate oxidase A [Hasllibacter halocynthiae]|uniref:Dihydroorotate dehydrogenase (quinone) n=1 Tax=Hasllibacter halocynthiae TaxID=595589 RepID=A0A2T0X6E8_9RHOB|nr:quinone-dependent dihydroorotate dehydrogenase [Hasllibacter halocynthiae]PRY94530.1 dihydroorotate oxidase A [Hasllibacter halocynthiae]
MIEAAALSTLRRLDPERAHDLSLRALRTGLVPGTRAGPVTSDRLRTTLAGIALPNPVGLAAGYDKNAVALAPLMRSGFGFLEVGAATPRPQPGNPRPRLFRLPEDRAVINRFGFNNEGIEAIAPRLRGRPEGIPVGLNLGANKDSPDRAADYVAVLNATGGAANFVTVNVSSPNTESLRDLQGEEALRALLAAVMDARGPGGAKVFLKIAPDLSDAGLDRIARTAAEAGIDGIVATNTTLSRGGLGSPLAGEAGGLSGAPLRRMATRALARLHRANPAMPLVGVGGVATAEDALERIEAGAGAVQLYTALVYGGLSLARRIPEGLDRLLLARGTTLENARGSRAAALADGPGP